MKNWKILVFVLVFGIVLFGCNGNGSAGVYAQSSNNEQKLIGTWTNINSNTTIVFNSNGTGTWDGRNFKYGAAVNKLVLYYSGNSSSYSGAYEFYISIDGKTLILIDNDKSGDGYAFRKST